MGKVKCVLTWRVVGCVMARRPFRLIRLASSPLKIMGSSVAQVAAVVQECTSVMFEMTEKLQIVECHVWMIKEKR